MRMLPWFVAGCAAFAACVADAHAQGVLYAWEKGTGIYEVDPSGPTATLLGGGAGAWNFPEIEYSYPDEVLCSDPPSGTVWSVSVNTGHIYAGGRLITFPPEGDTITALEWVDRYLQPGLLYAGLTVAGGGDTYLAIFRFDEDNFDVLVIGGPTTIPVAIGGLAYDGETMYALSAGGSRPKLYTIDLFTGIATLLGTITLGGDQAPPMTALEFGSDGYLYALPSTGEPEAGRLLRIDPQTLIATDLGFLGSTGFTSLTAPPADRCNEADLAAPFGTLDFSDVLAFLAAFGEGCP